ncbi:unnamed protein product, partial [Laminaria digitata]
MRTSCIPCFDRLKEDVDILVKVARQWAGCLTWSRVSHGGWSYPGITTRLLKQDLHKPQIEVCVNMKRIDGAGGAGGARRPGSDDSIQRNNKLPDGRNGWRWHSRCQTEGGRQDYVGSVAAKRRDRRDDYAEVALWDPQSRSLYANLAGVFGEEGMDAARRESAAAIAGRTELMARCYATLRVALQDIIEWKAPPCMLEAENRAAVRTSCLLWLNHTI